MENVSCKVSIDELLHDHNLVEGPTEAEIEQVKDYLLRALVTPGRVPGHIVIADEIIKEAIFNETGDCESIINSIIPLSISNPLYVGEVVADLVEEQAEIYATENYHQLKKYMGAE